jgi:hypothetical protein
VTEFFEFAAAEKTPSTEQLEAILPALFQEAMHYDDEVPMTLEEAELHKQQWADGDDGAGGLTEKAAETWQKRMTTTKGLKEETGKLLTLWQKNGFVIEGMGEVPGTQEKVQLKAFQKEVAKSKTLAREVLQGAAPRPKADRPAERAAFLAETDDGKGAWSAVLEDLPEAKTTEDLDVGQMKEFDRTHDEKGGMLKAHRLELLRKSGTTTVTPGVAMVINGEVHGYRKQDAQGLVDVIAAHLPKNELTDRRFPVEFVVNCGKKLAMGYHDAKRFDALIVDLKLKVGQVEIGAMLCSEREARLIAEAEAQGGRGVGVPAKDPDGVTMGVKYLHRVSEAKREKMAESVVTNRLQQLPPGWGLGKSKQESQAMRLMDTSQMEPVVGFAKNKRLAIVGDKCMNLLEAQLRVHLGEADMLLQDVVAVILKYDESENVRTFLTGFTKRVATAEFEQIGSPQYWLATADAGETEEMIAMSIEGGGSIGGAQTLTGSSGSKHGRPDNRDEESRAKRGRGGGSRGGRGNARKSGGRGRGREGQGRRDVRRTLQTGQQGQRGGLGGTTNSSNVLPNATNNTAVLGHGKAFTIGIEHYNPDVATKIPFVADKIKCATYGGGVGKGAYRALKEWRNRHATTDQQVCDVFGKCGSGSWLRSRRA